MKNKKGFTIVELITSFALASVIMTFLFSIVMVLKNTYISKHVKTELVIKQSLLSQKLNDDFISNNVTAIKTCGSKCYDISLSTGDTKRLIVSETGDMIKYGDYTYKLTNSSYVGKLNAYIEYIEVDSTALNNGILVIEIPIYNKKYQDENFGVKLIYQFNSNIYNISI